MVRDQKNKRKLEDLAAERAVLSGLCQYGLDAFLESDYLEPGHFTDATNQVLFECIKKSLQDVNRVELSSLAFMKISTIKKRLAS